MKSFSSSGVAKLELFFIVFEFQCTFVSLPAEITDKSRAERRNYFMKTKMAEMQSSNATRSIVKLEAEPLAALESMSESLSAPRLAGAASLGFSGLSVAVLLAGA